MKILTINIPEQTYEKLKMLRDLGYYTSISEALRRAVDQFLEYEFATKEGMEKFSNFLREYNRQIDGKLHILNKKLEFKDQQIQLSQGKVKIKDKERTVISVDIVENEEFVEQEWDGKKHKIRVREYFRGDVVYNPKEEETIKVPKSKPINEYYINEEGKPI